MKLNLRVAVGDEAPRDVVVQPTDIVAFERAYKMGFEKMTEDMHLEHIAWLAWHVDARKKVTTLDFEAWLDGMDTVEMGDDTPPLPQAPSEE